MRNEKATLMLCLLFFIGLQTLLATNPNFNVTVEDGPSRHYFTLSNDTSVVELNQLLPGQTYTIFVSGDQKDCLPMFMEATDGPKVVLTFVASQTQQLIHLGKECVDAIDIRFSIGCTSCPQNTSPRNPMGISTDQNYTATELIQDVFIGGDCFDVDDSSITSSGHNLSQGYFSGGQSSINLEEGIILSTGSVLNAVGPNDIYNTGNSFFNYVGDPDLTEMIGSSIIYDVTSIEFDFTPTTDQVSFDFVLASEEYCEYATSSFNDAFGFFISGPGINGPFTNGAENIALIPGTTNYTSINSVNHLNNPAYYVNNIPADHHGTMPAFLDCAGYPTSVDGFAIMDLEYDGYTSAMTAMANVQACETYHIKLIIADVTDSYFDSAVFLRANSFSAGQAASVSTDAPGGADAANIAYEDCLDSYFVFERESDDLSEAMTVNYTISNASTATAGVDYAFLPNSITIPAGDSTYLLPVDVFSDALVEGAESIILELEAPCSCDQPFVTLYIDDGAEIDIVTQDAFFCDPSTLTIAPLISGGVGTLTYQWSNGATTPSIDVFANTNTSYTLNVSDICGNVASATTDVSVVPVPTASISGYELVCFESPDAELVIDFTGVGPWEIVYSIDNVNQPPITGITDNPFTLNATTLGTYQLESVSAYNCDGSVQGAGTVAQTVFDLDYTTTDETCPEAADGSINVTVSGGLGPYTYSWDNGAAPLPNPTDLGTGVYALTFTDANGCGMSQIISVGLDPNVPTAEAGPDTLLTCSVTAVDLSGEGSANNIYSPLWTTNNGNIVANANSYAPTIDQPGIYQLQVTNVNTGCTITDEVQVNIDTLAPNAVINTVGASELNCANRITTLDGLFSMPNGQLDFSWTTQGGNILGDPNDVNPEVDAGGTYILTVTNILNGCIDTAQLDITADFELPTVNINTPELLTCTDSTVTLPASNSSFGTNYTILWTTGDGNFVADTNTLDPTVDQPGVYTLTIFNTSNQCESQDSVLVMEDREAPIADAGLPTELGCNDEMVPLDGSSSSIGNDYNYQWLTDDGVIETGANGLSPEVSTAGTYTLQVIDLSNGCTDFADVLVSEDTDVPYAMDILISEPQCFGEEGSISIPAVYGGEGPYVFSIDGGETFFNESFFAELQPGNFDLQVQDIEGCVYDSVTYIPAPYQVIVDVEPEVTIDLGESYTIQPSINIPWSSISTIRWTPEDDLDCVDCWEPTASPFNTTLYGITVMDENGCPASAEILVRVDKTRRIFIPNAFSPNVDGMNDAFHIFSKEGQVSRITNFQIFNRWGGKVFEVSDAMPNDPSFGWDGRIDGELANPAVYIYFAEIEFIDGETIMYKGDVTVTD